MRGGEVENDQRETESIEIVKKLTVGGQLIIGRIPTVRRLKAVSSA